ncbi:hypothetical protein BDZ91DRAFT_750005 [Kalaharituber pfeilii]|nr:hypothetical protein BDZ91DRAFT_750005 [Kalaharituber pfeilii]
MATENETRSVLNEKKYENDMAILAMTTTVRTIKNAKPAQLRIAIALIYGHDIACVAATGFGKSLAFQISCFFSPKKSGIIITPLTALAEDQVQECRAHRLNAIALTEEDLEKNDSVLNDILQGKEDIGYEKFRESFAPQG